MQFFCCGTRKEENNQGQERKSHREKQKKSANIQSDAYNFMPFWTHDTPGYEVLRKLLKAQLVRKLRGLRSRPRECCGLSFCNMVA